MNRLSLGLERLKAMNKGNWTGTAIGAVAFLQEWTVLDALGNWTTFKEDNNQGDCTIMRMIAGDRSSRRFPSLS